MHEYYFPEKYHNYVSDCCLGKTGKKSYIMVWLAKPLPKKLQLPAEYEGLEVRTELIEAP